MSDKTSARRGGSLPWVFGGTGVAAVFGALAFGTSKNQEMRDLEAELQSERQITNQLRQAFAEQRAEQASASANDLDSQQQRLENELNQVRTGFATAVVERDQLQRELIELNGVQQRVLPQMTARQIKLEDDLDGLQTELTEVRTERDDLQQTLIEATSKLASTEQRPNDPKPATTATVNANVDADTNANTTEHELQEQLQHSREQVSKLSRTRDRLNEKLLRNEDQLTTLSNERDGLSEKLTQSEDQLKALSSERDGLQQLLSQSAPKTESQALRNQLRAAEVRAEATADVLTQIAERLDVPLGQQDWAKPNKSPDGKLKNVVAKLDQTLAADQEFRASVTESRYFNPPKLAVLGTPTPQRPRNPLLKPGDKKLDELHFSTGSAHLSPGAERKAKQVAALFRQRPVGKLKILGFSDTVGASDGNLSLSRQRARSVADMLVNAGVPRERIEVVASGEENLPEPTINGVSEPLNRCVGIFVSPED